MSRSVRRQLFHQRLFNLIVVVLLLSLCACGSGGGGDQKQRGTQTTIRVSGAWALYPMMVKWTEEFQNVYPDIRFNLSAGGAGKGMADVLFGMVDIGMVSRGIYPAEIENGAFSVSVTKDAVVPVVNADNPVLAELLTKGVKRQAFTDIWISGNITDWRDVIG